MALPLIIGAIGLGLSALGAGQQHKDSKRAERAEKRAAKAAEEAAEFTAKQYEAKAIQEVALASQDAAEEQRQGRILASNARAIGAASGAGGYESSIADIQGAADYRMLIALYNGEISARDMELAAEVSRREGADAARAHAAQARGYRSRSDAIRLQSSADFLSNAMTLYERYGQSNNTAIT